MKESMVNEWMHEWMNVNDSLMIYTDRRCVMYRKCILLYCSRVCSCNIAECHYNAVQYTMTLNTVLQWLRPNITERFYSQKTPHISPSRVSNGVSVVRIRKKIDPVKTAPYCVSFTLSMFFMTKMSNIVQNSTLHSPHRTWILISNLPHVDVHVYAEPLCTSKL